MVGFVLKKHVNLDDAVIMCAEYWWSGDMVGLKGKLD